jgi:hypothetical protein
LYRILDFLSLVNLMNQFRSVIDQTHGRFTRNTGTAQTIDVGNAQAVETQMRFFDLDEKLLPPARRLKRKFNGEFLFGLADAFKQRRSADGIGTENARSSPPLGVGVRNWSGFVGHVFYRE